MHVNNNTEKKKKKKKKKKENPVVHLIFISVMK